MKRLNFILFITIAFICGVVCVSGQTPPPKTGKYLCYMFGIAAQSEVQMVFNTVTQQMEQRVGTAWNGQLTPAAFNLVLSSKNTYSMPPSTGKGTYQFDSETSKVSFTGDITRLTYVTYGIAKKGEYVFNFKDDKTKTPYVCEMKTTATDSVVADNDSAPKAGAYYCYTTTYVVGAGGGRGGNPSTSGDVFGNNPIQVQPAFFGDLVLDGNGNYRLTRQKTTGKYTFDKATNNLSFTGDLKIMQVRNYSSKNNSFFLTYDTTAFHCGLKGQKPNASDGNPGKAAVFNEGLSGKILTTQSDENNGFIGKVFEFDLAKGDYSVIFPDGVAAQNSKGEILHIDKESRIKIADRTGNSTLKQLTNNINYNSSEIYPAISNSGDYLALTVANKSNTGTLSDLISNGIKILVTDRNLNQVAQFIGFRQAAWMPNGGLVVIGDGGTNKGLFVIDPKFKSVKKIVEGYDYAQMPAVSPDGKTIAFSNKGEIWTINLDGTNPIKALFGNFCTFPAWSPDGKYIIATVEIRDTITKNALYIVNLQADKGFYLKDGNGDYVESKNRITWLPAVMNTSITVNNPQIQNNEPKVSTNSLTAYNPTTENKDPNFAKANEMYREVMGDDLENYNDAAAAFTYIVVLNYMYLHQQNSVPTNQVRQVYKQFVEKLSQTEGFKDSNNETKQELAELAILDGIETLNAVNSKDQKKINEVSLRIMKKYIGKNAEIMKITDNGMEF